MTLFGFAVALCDTPDSIVMENPALLEDVLNLRNAVVVNQEFTTYSLDGTNHQVLLLKNNVEEFLINDAFKVGKCYVSEDNKTVVIRDHLFLSISYI
jgi:hypothetical protein